MKYNPPPNWPAPPQGWTPQPGWTPDPTWGAAPEGWQLWVPEPGEAPAAPLAAPAVKRNWFLRHKVLTGLGAAVIVFGIIGAVSGGGGSKTPVASTPDAATSTTSSPAPAVANPSPAAVKTTPPAPLKSQIGQPFRDGKFQFTVTKVKKGVSRVGTTYLNKKAQGQFVEIFVTVKNIGNEAQTLDDSSQYLYNAKGQKADADSEAGIYANSNSSGDSVFFNDINPGNSVKGVLVFDVAKTYVPTVLEVHDSVFSGGKKIRIS